MGANPGRHRRTIDNRGSKSLSPLRPIARRALAAQSDDRLVRLLREGHEPAFEEIVRRYRGPLVAFATAIVSHSRAEDVVQGSLEKAHRALLADSREVTLKPWLFTIVRNGALNTIRAEPLAEELITATSTVPGPAELAEQNDELERLVDAICALPPAQRQALVKRELEGEGHGEIAAELGTSATAVRGLIFRARTTLRDAVGALVPLPAIRMLLTEGTAAAGGAAASSGVSAAVLGGAGAKGGTVIAAAIVALGTGIAVERGNRGQDQPDNRAEAAVVRAAADGGTGVGTDSGSDPLATDGSGGDGASIDPSGGTVDRGGDGGSGTSEDDPTTGDGSSGPSGGGSGSGPDPGEGGTEPPNGGSGPSGPGGGTGDSSSGTGRHGGPGGGGSSDGGGSHGGPGGGSPGGSGGPSGGGPGGSGGDGGTSGGGGPGGGSGPSGSGSGGPGPGNSGSGGSGSGSNHPPGAPPEAGEDAD